MAKRIWIYLALAASLAGCAQPTTVSDSFPAKADEGVIVFSMKCGPGIAWAQIYRSGVSAKGYTANYRRAGLLQCPDGVQTQKLQAGHYFVGRVGYQTLVDFSEESAMQFDVTAGKLNYIGHITLPSTLDETEGSRGRVLISDPVVNDRRAAALAWITTNQPALHGQHEFVAGLAQGPSRLITDALANDALADDALAGHSSATQFTVILKLRVAADGSVREGHIARPSGNSGVDETARNEAVRTWSVAPGTAGGKPVEKWDNYSVTYRPAS